MMYIFLGVMILLTILEVGSILREGRDQTEFERGVMGAKSSIEDGHDAQELLDQARGDLDKDDFNRGWIEACKKHLEWNNKL